MREFTKTAKYMATLAAVCFITVVVLIFKSCDGAGPSEAVKHHAEIVDLVEVESGVLRKKKNVAYTVVELEDGSRHRLAGDFGKKGDDITVWVGGGRCDTKPFKFK